MSEDPARDHIASVEAVALIDGDDAAFGVDVLALRTARTYGWDPLEGVCLFLVGWSQVVLFID